MKPDIDAILRDHDTIHVVGISSKPERDSHSVAAYLQRAGYRIVPVNPALESALGERAYPSLAAAADEGPVRLVDVFRASSALPEVVDDVLAAGGVEVVWLQLGIGDPESEARLEQAGITVVRDRCMKVEHARWARQQAR